jgi:FK506-binding protein 2
MKTAIFLSLVASTIGLVAAAELKVDVTVPVECERKTQKGDKVSMHYHGKLAETGKKFDASTFRQPCFPFLRDPIRIRPRTSPPNKTRRK